MKQTSSSSASSLTTCYPNQTTGETAMTHTRRPIQIPVVELYKAAVSLASTGCDTPVSSALWIASELERQIYKSAAVNPDTQVAVFYPPNPEAQS